MARWERSWLRHRAFVALWAGVAIANVLSSCADDPAVDGGAGRGSEAGDAGESGGSGGNGRGGDSGLGGSGRGGAGGADDGGQAGEGGEGGTGANGDCGDDLPSAASECQENECENGALCLNEGGREVTCICPPGFAGSRCELAMRDCSLDDPPCDPTTSETACAECRRPQVEAGEAHTCHLDEAGRITCWGADDALVAGLGCTVLSHPPLGVFETLSSGAASCAVSATGDTACWGVCFEECEGAGGLVPPEGPQNVVSIARDRHCALDRDWELHCQTTGSFEEPPVGRFLTVSLGNLGGCALDLDRRAHCWGSAHLDDRTCSERTSSRFRSISVGFNHVCAVRIDQQVACWGANGRGQASPPSGSFRHVSSGHDHTCGLREDGSIECWGDPSLTGAPSGAFTEVTVGAQHSCALRTDGKVECWGKDDSFQLHPPRDLAPAEPPPAVIAVGGEYAYSDEMDDCSRLGRTSGCELDAAGRVSCFGSPLGAAPAGTFREISVGYGTACGVRDDGAVACWGGIPVDPENQSTTYAHVAAGYGLACAVTNAGNIECWELEDLVVDYHELRSAGAPPSGTFTQVSVSTDPRYVDERMTGDVAYNSPHACALATDGSAHCWGYVGSVRERVVPGPFVAVDAGHQRDCALDADGVAWCWSPSSEPPEPMDGTFRKIGVGKGFWGLSVDGSIWTRGPLDIDETFVDLAVAGDFSCAQREDGAVRCFGSRVR